MGSPYNLLSGEHWEEEALDEFDRLTHCADWKPLVAKISSYVQTGVSTWPKIYLYDTSNGKVRLGFTHSLLTSFSIFIDLFTFLSQKNLSDFIPTL